MSTATLNNKGQTIMPKGIRKRLNLHPRDRLEFVIDEKSRVLVLPASIDASESVGMIKRPPSETFHYKFDSSPIPLRNNGTISGTIRE